MTHYSFLPKCHAFTSVYVYVITIFQFCPSTVVATWSPSLVTSREVLFLLAPRKEISIFTSKEAPSPPAPFRASANLPLRLVPLF